MKLNKIDSKTVKHYQNLLTQRGASEATIKRNLSSLRKFSGWLTHEGYLKKDPLVISPRRSPFGHLRGVRLAPKVAFQAYRALPYFTYLNFLILLVFLSALGWGLYQQFVVRAPRELAYPAGEVGPKRYLSFQGRLTDSNYTPIGTAVNMEFKLYDAAGIGTGTLLWESGVCSVDPDQDGIFALLLGTPSGEGYTCSSALEIPSHVFSENAEVWLETKVASETLSPRIQIATVAYALNAETLQGFPLASAGSTTPEATMGATARTVPAINPAGNLVIASDSPTIWSTSGTFGIKGQAISIQTDTGTGGNITLAPDGTGVLNIVPTSGNQIGGTVNATNSALTTGALYTGRVENGNTGFDFLRFFGGTSPTERFSVGALGNVDMANNLNVGGAATITGTLRVDGSLISNLIPSGTRNLGSSGSNWDYLYVNNLDAFTLQGAVTGNNQTITGLEQLTVNNLRLDVNTLDSTSGNLTLLSAGELYFEDTRTGAIPFSSSDTTLNAALTQAIIDAINETYEAATGVGGVSGFWTKTSGLLFPNNTYESVAVGGTATTSAKLYFQGTTGNASMSGDLTFAGGGTIGATDMGNLTIGNSTTQNVIINPKTQIQLQPVTDSTTFFQVLDSDGGTPILNIDATSERVGIGTSSPAYTLHLAGSQSDYLGYLYNSSTNAAAAGLYIRVDGDGNLLTLNAGGSDIVTISEAQSVFNNPTSFTSAGDVSIAYDLFFTNQTASYIKSNAPLYLEAGETFESNDLTLRTYNKGNVIVDSEAFVTNYAATVSSQLVVGTVTAPGNIGGFYLTNAGTYGKALAIFNQTEGADIFTASSSGTTRMTLTSAGNLSISGGLTVGGGTTYYFNSSGHINANNITGAGTLDINGAGTHDIAGTLNLSGNALTSTGDLTITPAGGDLLLTGNFLPSTGDTYDLGSTTAYWNNLYVNNIFGSSGGTQGFWTKTTGLIYPNNTYESIAIGGTSTASAKLYFEGTTGNASMAGTLTIGQGQTIRPAYGPLQLAYKSGPNAWTTGMVINESGNVGIGTTNPAGRLYVRSSALSSSPFVVAASDNSWLFQVYEAAGGTGYATVRDADGTSQVLLNSSGNSYFNGGNVGIGTTTPTALLDVAGDASTSGSLVFRTSTSSIDILNGEALEIKTSVGGDTELTTKFSISNTGQISYWNSPTSFTFGQTMSGDTGWRFLIGNNATGTLSWGGGSGSVDTNLYRSAADTLATDDSLTVGTNLTINGNVDLGNATSDTITATGRFDSSLVPSATSTYDLGSSSLYWNNLYANNIYGGTGGTQGYWTKGSGLIYPNNTYESVAIGGTATSSAKLYFEGTTGNASMAGTLTIGQGQTIRPAYGPLQLAYKSGPNAWTTGMVINESGNVGIGTTGPSALLHVQGLTDSTEMTTNMFTVRRNKITNGGLEGTYVSGVAPNWTAGTGTLAEETSDCRSGLKCQKISNNGGSGYIKQNVSVTAGTSYLISAWAKGDGSTNRPSIYYTPPGGSQTLLTSTTSTSWTLISGVVTPASGGNLSVQLYIQWNVGSTHDAWWDDVSVTPLDSKGAPLDTSFLVNIDGNVGIGTTSPVGKLEVSGTNTGKALAIFNQTEGADILTASSSGTTRFVLTSAGRVGIGTALPSAMLDIVGDLEVNGYATVSSSLALGTSSAPAGPGNLKMSGLLDIDGTGIHDIAGTLNLSGNALTSSGDLTITPAGGDILSAGNILPSTGNTYDLGASTAYWNNLYVNNIYGGSSGTSGYWTKGSGLIYPNNTYESVAVGGTATSSAKLYFEGTTGNASMSGNLTLTGGGTIGATDMNNLTLGDSSTQNVIINPNGNVGIGTTGPNSKAEIVNTSAGNETTALRLTNAQTTTNTAVNLMFNLSTVSQDSAKITAVRLNSPANTDAALTFSTTGNGSLAERLRISPTGNVGIGTTEPVGKLQVSGTNAGKALAIFNESGTVNDILTASSSGSPRFTVSNSGNLTFSGSANTITNANQLTLSTTGASSDLVLSAGRDITFNDDNLTSAVPLSLADSALNANLGQAIIDAINDAYEAAIGSGGISGFWTKTLGLIYPNNNYESVAVGGTSTASAKLYFEGTTGNASMAGTLTIGQGQTIRPAYGPLQLAYKSGPNAWTTGMVINESGNVGIGTTGPGYKLDITSTVAGDDYIKFTNSSGASTDQMGLFLSAGNNDPLVVYRTNGPVYWVAGVDASDSNKYKIATTTELGIAGNDRLVINTSGNVGIGTTTPTALLDVAGDASTSGSLVFRGTSPATIDILNGDDLRFQTSVGGDAVLTPRMTITNAGNVGIGTTGPNFSLDIGGYGTPTVIGGGTSSYPLAIATNTDGSANIEMVNTSSGGSADFRFSVLDNSKQNVLSFVMPSSGYTSTLFGSARNTSGYIFINNLGAGTPRNLTIGVVTANDLIFGTNNAENMRIKSGGNVGIGTTDPLAKFEVSEPTAANLYTYYRARGGNSLVSGSIFLVNDSGGGARGGSIGSDGSINGGLVLAGDSGGAGAANADMFIQSGGNVGIGTTGPQSILHVRSSADNNIEFGEVSGESQIRSINDARNANLPLQFTASEYNFNVGSVGIGTTAPDMKLHVQATSGSSSILRLVNSDYVAGSVGSGLYFGTGATSGDTYTRLQVITAGGAGTGNLSINSSGGNVGIGTTAPVAPLHISKGYGSNAALIVDQLNSGDILTASASGSTKFAVSNSGNLTFSGSANTITNANQLTLSTSGASSDLVLSAGRDITFDDSTLSSPVPLTLSDSSLNANLGQAIIDAINDAYEAAIGSGGISGFWTKTSGLLFPNNTYESVAIGGTATSSAKLYFEGTTGNASMAGTLTIGQGQTIRPAYGPLQLAYKSGPNAWTTGMVINESGNVGIGTTGPTYKLQVAGGNVYLEDATYLGNTNTYFDTNGNLYIDPSGGSNEVKVRDAAYFRLENDAQDANITLQNTGGTGVAQLAITGGNVGIGTTAPTAKLSVAGGGYFTGDLSSASQSAILSQPNNLNVAPNVSFEVTNSSATATNADNWDLTSAAGDGTASIAKSSDNSSNGAYSIKTVLTGTTSYARMFSTAFPVSPSTLHNLSVDITGACASGFYLRAFWYDQWGNAASTPSSDAFANYATTASWVTYSNNVTSPANAYFAKIEIYNYRCASTRYYDNVVFRQTSFPGAINFAVNSGNVGIGTTSPTAKLDVAGDASTSGSLVFRGTSPATIDILNGDDLRFQTSVGGDLGLTPRMTITNAGNVGVGTVGPLAQLHVAIPISSGAITTAAKFTTGGSGVNTGTAIELGWANTSPASAKIAGFYDGGTVMSFYTGDGTNPTTEAMRISAGGNVGIGTTVPVAPLHISKGYGSNAALIVNQLNSGDIITASASGTKMTLSNAGNLAIEGALSDLSGTTLSINDNLSVTGNIVPSAGSTYDLGSPGAYWNNLYVNNLFGGTGGTQGHWSKSNGLIYPNNTYESVAIGGTATTSAKLYFEGTTGNASMSGNLAFAGGGTIGATDMNNLTIGDANTNNVQFYSGSYYLNPSGQLTLATNETINGLDISAGAITDLTGLTFDGSARTITNANQLTLSTTGASSDLVLSAGRDITFNDDNLTSAVPLSLADSALNANLGQAIIDAINDAYEAAVGSGGISGFWTKTSGLLFPNNTYESVAIGGTATSSAKLYFEGTTGNASMSGTLTIGQGQTIRPAYGPLQLAYKSGPNTWTTGMVINESGNVGIGTTGPNYKLEVDGTADIGTVLTIGNGAVGYIGSGATPSRFILTGRTGYGISLGSNNVNDRLYMDTSGNVGIGTTGPGQKLSVLGNIETVNNTSDLGSGLVTNGTFDTDLTGWTNSGIATFEWSAGTIHIAQTGTGYSNFYQNTVTLIPGELYYYSFDATLNSGTSLIFQQGPNTSIRFFSTSGTYTGTFVASADSNNTIRFKINNAAADWNLDNISVEKVGAGNMIARGLIVGGGNTNGGSSGIKILDSGNVGIGTTSPLEKLDIAGNATMSGTLTLGQGQTLRPAFGPLQLAYKSGANAWTTGMVMTESGNVGIGTTSPNGRLQVVGDEVRIGDAGTIGYATADGDLYVEDALEVDGSAYLTTTYFGGGTSYSINSSGQASLNTEETINGVDINAGTISDATWQGTAIGTQYGGTGQNWSGVAQGSVPYFNGPGTMTTLTPSTAGYVLTTQGASANPTWTASSGLGTNYWTKTTGLLYPNNTYESVAVGGTATTSAKLYFEGTTGNASMSGDLTLAGGGTVKTTDMNPLTIGGSTTGGITIDSGTGSITLADNTDVSDFDITSIDKLEGYDTGLFIDMGQDSQIIISSDGAGTPFASPDIDITGSVYFDDHLGLASGKQIQFADTGEYIVSDGTNLSLVSGGDIILDPAGGDVTIDGNILPNTGNTYNLGSSSLYWNNLYANNIYGGSSGTSGYWTKGSGLIYPNNTYESVAIGGTATTSAKLYFEGTTGNASMSGDLTLTGGGTIKTTDMNALTIGGSTTGGITIDSGTGSITLSDNTTISSDLTVSGGDITGTGNESLDIGEATADTIQAYINATSELTLTDEYLRPTTDAGLSLGQSGNEWNNLWIKGIAYLDALTMHGNITMGGYSLNDAGTIQANTIEDNDDTILALNDNLSITGNVLPSAGSTYNLGSSSLPWNNAYANNIFGSSSGTQGFWTKTSGVLYPNNTYESVAIGGTSTTSAKLLFSGPTGNASMSGNLTLFGATPAITTTNLRNLTLGDISTGNVIIYKDLQINGEGIYDSSPTLRLTLGSTINAFANLNVTQNLTVDTDTFFVNASTNRVGIGTTDPQAKLDIAGANSLISNSSGDITLDAYSGYISFSSDYISNLGGIYGDLNVTGNILNSTAERPVKISDWTLIQTSTPSAALMVDQTGVGDIFTASTSGVPKFVIKNSGYVGVNTSIPNRLLHVYGGDAGTDPSWLSTQLMLIENSGSAFISFFTPSSNAAGLTFSDGDGAATGWMEYIHASDRLDFGTTGFTRMVIDSSGNVGIGTTGPNAILEVSGAAGATNLEIARFINTADSVGAYISIIGDTTGQDYAVQLLADSNGGLRIATGETTPGTYGTTDFIIQAGGNVGIGTTSPDTALDVGSGAVKAGNGYALGTRQGSNYRIDIGTTSASCANVTWIGIQYTWSVAFSATPKCLTTGHGGGNWLSYHLASAGCTTTLGQHNIYQGSGATQTCTAQILGYGPTTMTDFDLAEGYKTKDQTIESGEVVCIDPENNSHIVKCTKPYDATAIGIVSTEPGLIIGDELTPNSRLVGLQGRVPVKVTLENGPIKRGDPLTPSATKPGFAMKAIKGGQIIGKAIQPFNGNSTVLGENAFDGISEDKIKEIISKTQATGEGQTMAFINVSWYDPDVYLTDTGELNIAEINTNITNTTNKYQLTNRNTVIDRVGAFAELVVANFKAGLIQTQELFAEKKIVSPLVETDEIRTNIISLKRSDLEGGPTSQESGFGKLLIQNERGKTVASIDSSGNASFGGLLEAAAVTSDQLSVTGDATVAGTLYAGEIVTEKGTFGELLARVENLESSSTMTPQPEADRPLDETLEPTPTPADTSEVEEFAEEETVEATDSGLLADSESWPISDPSNDILITNSLTVLGTSSLADTSVAGQLMVDATIIIDRDGIQTLPGSNLKLQAYGWGGIDMLDGKVVIDTEGNVLITGELIAKKITTGGLVLTENTNLNECQTNPNECANESGFGKLLSVLNKEGLEVASIDASGSAFFASLGIEADYTATQSGAIIAAFDNYYENGYLAPAIKTNATAGIGILPAYEEEVMIYNPQVTGESLIYVTATTNTENKVLYVKAKKAAVSQTEPGWFIVALNESITKDIQFNWWIIDAKTQANLNP